MKDGMKAFLLGGKNLHGKTGVLAAIAGAAIGIVGTVASTIIGNKLAYKGDREIGTEEEEAKNEVEVEAETEEVTEEVTDKG